MRFFTVFAILFYATVLILIGSGVVIFSLNLFDYKEITQFFNFVLGSMYYRGIILTSGVIIIVVSYLFAKIIFGRFQSEKTIAFSTASGEVTIALSAIEDVLKNISSSIAEIKEIRPDVIATKKGILVNLKVILNAEANLPDLTTKLQEVTKSKIQEVLGLDEAIIIKIHIFKIIKEEKDKRKKDSVKEEPIIPFSGFGRV